MVPAILKHKIDHKRSKEREKRKGKKNILGNKREDY